MRAPVDLVEVAPPGHLLALPEHAHHLDGLLEHGEAHVGRRPAMPEHVLVEVLAAADAEAEPALEQDRRRRRRLGQHHRVDAHRRARHRGGDPERCRRRDAADHRPHEGALALVVEPGMEVIGDPHGGEAVRLGELCLLHELPRTVLLR